MPKPAPKQKLLSKDWNILINAFSPEGVNSIAEGALSDVMLFAYNLKHIVRKAYRTSGRSLGAQVMDVQDSTAQLRGKSPSHVSGPWMKIDSSSGRQLGGTKYPHVKGNDALHVTDALSESIVSVITEEGKVGSVWNKLSNARNALSLTVRVGPDPQAVHTHTDYWASSPTYGMPVQALARDIAMFLETGNDAYTDTANANTPARPIWGVLIPMITSFKEYDEMTRMKYTRLAFQKLGIPIL